MNIIIGLLFNYKRLWNDNNNGLNCFNFSWTSGSGRGWYHSASGSHTFDICRNVLLHLYLYRWPYSKSWAIGTRNELNKGFILNYLQYPRWYLGYCSCSAGLLHNWCFDGMPYKNCGYHTPRNSRRMQIMSTICYSLIMYVKETKLPNNPNHQYILTISVKQALFLND